MNKGNMHSQTDSSSSVFNKSLLKFTSQRQKNPQPPKPQARLPESVVYNDPAEPEKRIHNRMLYVEVDPDNYEGYFANVYDYLTTTYSSLSQPPDQNLISKDRFVLLCKYLLKARVDTVYSRVTGSRPSSRISTPSGLQVPKSISTIINTIGLVTINEGSYTICPKPAEETIDEAPLLERVGNNDFLAFTSFVSKVLMLKIIETGTLTTVCPGGPWWILTAREVSDTSKIAAQNAENCQVHGTFQEWTVLDARLASIVMNQFDGIIADLDQLLWIAEPALSITELRNNYTANA